MQDYDNGDNKPTMSPRLQRLNQELRLSGQYDHDDERTDYSEQLSNIDETLAELRSDVARLGNAFDGPRGPLDEIRQALSETCETIEGLCRAIQDLPDRLSESLADRRQQDLASDPDFTWPEDKVESLASTIEEQAAYTRTSVGSASDALSHLGCLLLPVTLASAIVVYRLWPTQWTFHW